MKNFLIKLLTRKSLKKSQLPKVGEFWGLYDKSPWPIPGSKVEIISIKNGWVRYNFSDIFIDQRLEVKIFLKCYKKMIDEDFI